MTDWGFNMGIRRMRECCLIPNEQFSSQEQVTFDEMVSIIIYVCFVLQCAGRYVDPLWHIILIHCRSLFFILKAAWLSEKHQIPIVFVFGLTRLLLEPMIYYRGEPAIHYTTDAVPIPAVVQRQLYRSVSPHSYRDWFDFIKEIDRRKLKNK